METIIWIFQNIIPWIGIWFTVMTVIYFLSVIYVGLKEKFWTRTCDYNVDRFFELTIFISLVPWFLVLLSAGVIGSIRESTKLVRTKPKTVK